MASVPTPDRTSLDDIVAAARDLLDAGGPARLTMQAVAERVGVRAPSLYKRVRNRDDLVRLVVEATIRDLGDRLHAVIGSGDPRADLIVLARTLRAFAHAHPAGFHLVFARLPEQSRPDPALRTYSVEPVMRTVTALAGPAEALEAARTITAWANGFITMELAGAFNLGGDVDHAFEFGIDRLADALARTPEA